MTPTEIIEYDKRMDAIRAPYEAIGIKLKATPHFVEVVRDIADLENTDDPMFIESYKIIEKAFPQLGDDFALDFDRFPDGIHVYIDQIPATII